ncbi:MAG TPA: glycosyltransferase [Candidatus Saccharimonadia bacterium]|jgi:glycosyltransferase involved in cell wall biosynthesis|nr:glycosyltransferase [Candidatus Saccharimonadia bacterium]
MPQPEVSVIIPARNESEHIIGCLTSLAAQTGASVYEVILVDNGSTDDTAILARQFAKDHPGFDLKVLSEPRPGRGPARAAGFAAARGTFLLSSDSDTQVPKHWVASLTRALRTGRYVAVTGNCRVIDCRPRTNFMINNTLRWGMRSYRLIVGHWWLTGSNFGITRTAYDLSGGFGTDVRDQEDIDLSWRVHRLGRIRFMPARDAVTTAGDRFSRGTIYGVWGYVRAYTGRFILRQGDRFARED